MLSELAKSSHWSGSFLLPGPYIDRGPGDRPGDPGQRRGKTGDVCMGPGPSKCVRTCVCARVHVCAECTHVGAHMCAKCGVCVDMCAKCMHVCACMHMCAE